MASAEVGGVTADRVHLNRAALLELSRRVLAAVVEGRGEIPKGHEAGAELALLPDCCRVRVDFYLVGARDAADLMEPAFERRLAALRETKEAEAAMMAERVRIFGEEADAWRERAEAAEAALARRHPRRLWAWAATLLFGLLFWVLFLGALALLGGRG